MQTVLLLGGSGRLGSALRARWDHVVAPPSSELDLRDDDAIARRIDELEPALIVNCAGLTDVDGCERDPQAAMSSMATPPDDSLVVRHELGFRASISRLITSSLDTPNGRSPRRTRWRR